MAFLDRLFRRAPHPVDMAWRKKVDSNLLCSHDAAASPVTEMRFGYHGEIFVKFADGRDTCIWPTGAGIWPHQTGVRSTHSTPEAGEGA